MLELFIPLQIVVECFMFGVCLIKVVLLWCQIKETSLFRSSPWSSRSFLQWCLHSRNFDPTCLVLRSKWILTIMHWDILWIGRIQYKDWLHVNCCCKSLILLWRIERGHRIKLSITCLGWRMKIFSSLVIDAFEDEHVLDASQDCIPFSQILLII